MGEDKATSGLFSTPSGGVGGACNSTMTPMARSFRVEELGLYRSIVIGHGLIL
jgi:hypothetical protein